MEELTIIRSISLTIYGTPKQLYAAFRRFVNSNKEEEMYHDDYYGDIMEDCDFADPGGGSALRAATKDNPRNLPCPNCGEPDRLTRADKVRGYQCDACADALERGGY